MSIVADTGALYALYDADDRHHEAVRRVIENARGLIIIPTVILAELDYLLREFLGVGAELDFLESVSSGAFTLEPFTGQDLKRCIELITNYRDLDIGLVDAGVMATAERLAIREILTVDERDFRAVSPKSGYFTLLPAMNKRLS
ncbi:MAG: PIN domain-containing protein [Gammaproteobacteria bacterium]|nr:PIN domain-containing protein [Gammaproteobacteria bacterium]